MNGVLKLLGWGARKGATTSVSAGKVTKKHRYASTEQERLAKDIIQKRKKLLSALAK